MRILQDFKTYTGINYFRDWSKKTLMNKKTEKSKIAKKEEPKPWNPDLNNLMSEIKNL